MTIAVTKVGGWSLNEKLTSAQMTAVDGNIVNALDKRAGQSDVLSSTITVGATGSIDFLTGSALLIESGVAALFKLGSSATFQSGSALTVNSGAVLQLLGAATSNTTFTMASGGNLVVASGAASTFNSGSTLTVSGAASFSDISLSSSALIKFSSTRNQVRWFFAKADQDSKYSSFVIRNFTTAHLTATSSCTAMFDLDGIPNGATFSKITVYFKPIGGHAGLPAVFSTLRLSRYNPSTNTNVTIGSLATDTAVDVAAYEATTRTLEVTTTTIVDAANYAYKASFISESGTNALQGLQVYGLKVEFTTDKMNDF